MWVTVTVGLWVTRAVGLWFTVGCELLLCVSYCGCWVVSYCGLWVTVAVRLWVSVGCEYLWVVSYCGFWVVSYCWLRVTVGIRLWVTGNYELLLCFFWSHCGFELLCPIHAQGDNRGVMGQPALRLWCTLFQHSQPVAQTTSKGDNKDHSEKENKPPGGGTTAGEHEAQPCKSVCRRIHGSIHHRIVIKKGWHTPNRNYMYLENIKGKFTAE